MHKLVPYLLTAVLLILPAAAQAQAAAGPIATVDIQKIMKESTAYQDISDQMDRKQKSYQAEISHQDEDLQKENQKLGHERSVLSKDAFEKKVEAFRTKATEVQKEVDSKKALLNAAFEHAMGELQKTVNDVVADLAKEKGFIVAIPSSETLYADPKLDISDEVVKRLNEKLPKMKVSFDASDNK